MYNCTDCTYTSNRKHNLKCHILRKHNRILKPQEERDVVFVPVILVVEETKEFIPVIEEDYILKCTICTKQFKSSQGLKYHITVCKGVSNILECHFCHKVFSFQSAKSRHIKTCKVKKDKLKALIEEELKEKAEEELKEEEVIEVLPIVKTKKKKTIPHILRQTVWDTWIGEDFGTSKCWCCKKNQIRQMNFDCGHVVSEYAGGKAILENLRPICRICNSSMQTENMIEFMERLKL